MAEKKVSVIVPVYNAENYLRECLDSAARQTLREIEILCVDDCSTDGSPGILKEYAARDPRFRVLRTDRNRGQANARNMGLDSAAGEYVYFMDDDDYLARDDAFALLVEAAGRDAVDAVVFTANIVYETKRLYDLRQGQVQAPDEVAEGLFSGESFFRLGLGCGKLGTAAWRQFWRRSFLLEHQLNFQENTFPHDDVLFSLKAYLSAGRIRHIREALYTYRVREGSGMTSGFKSRNLLAFVSTYLSSLRFAARFRAAEEGTPETLLHYLTRQRQDLWGLCVRLIREGGDLNPLFADAGIEGAFLKDLFKERFPLLDRPPTPEEYLRLSACDKIIIYGAGKTGRDMRRLLEDMELENYVAAATAPSPESSARGVRAIADLAGYARCVVVLAVQKPNQREMKANLRRLAFAEPICLCGETDT